MTPSSERRETRLPSVSAGDVDAATLWNLIPDGLFVVEPGGVIVAANEAAAELFGAGRAGLVGRSIDSLLEESSRAVHEAQRALWMLSPEPRLMGARPTFPALGVDGRRIHVQVALHPVRVDGQDMTIVVVRDATDHTRSSTELADVRDSAVQRLFGLGMSLRSLASAVEPSAVADRIAEVVNAMGDVADAIGSGGGEPPLPVDDG